MLTAFIPFASATLAVDTPGAWHALTTSRLNSLEYRPRLLLAGQLISEISIASPVSISTRCWTEETHDPRCVAETLTNKLRIFHLVPMRVYSFCMIWFNFKCPGSFANLSVAWWTRNAGWGSPVFKKTGRRFREWNGVGMLWSEIPKADASQTPPPPHVGWFIFCNGAHFSKRNFSEWIYSSICRLLYMNMAWCASVKENSAIWFPYLGRKIHGCVAVERGDIISVKHQSSSRDEYSILANDGKKFSAPIASISALYSSQCNTFVSVNTMSSSV